MLATRLRLSLCPYCGHTLDAVTTMTAKKVAPEPGDTTVCIRCAFVLVLDDQMVPRKPHPGELEAEYAADPELAATTKRHQRAAVLSGIELPWPKFAERKH